MVFIEIMSWLSNLTINNWRVFGIENLNWVIPTMLVLMMLPNIVKKITTYNTSYTK